MSTAVHEFEYNTSEQVYYFMADIECGLIGCTRPALDGLPDPINNPVGLGETYRKALGDLRDTELK